MTGVLPDNVRSALNDARISYGDMLLMTGDQLIERVGSRITYELAAVLARTDQAFAHYPGRAGRISPDPQLRNRNLEVLRLSIVEWGTGAEVATAVGVSRARIAQILRDYFGIRKAPGPPNWIALPAEALVIVRVALRGYLLTIMQDLANCLRTGAQDLSDGWARLDIARDLLRDSEAEDQVHVSLGRRRAFPLIDALGKQLVIERDLASTARGPERRRHSDNVVLIEQLRSQMHA